SKALDYFDLKGKSESLAQALRHVKARFLVLSFSSDWLYPPYQSREIVKALKQNGLSVSYCEIKSEYGHDSFLLDNPQQIRFIRDFLHHVSEEVQSNAA
ncbi:MAG: homoserine O-acetyltransferase, partial [Candidatus Hinthialibacter sp.]